MVHAMGDFGLVEAVDGLSECIVVAIAHAADCKPEMDLREVLNVIRYMARSGAGWRMLPHDFPPWQTVYWWFRRFVRMLLFRTIHDVALMIDRERAGSAAQPTVGFSTASR